MRYRLMASYRGTSYQAGVGPSISEVTLIAAWPPPEDHGFMSAGSHWRKQVRINDIEALWESRPVGSYHGEPCLVLDDLGDRLHIAYLGMDSARAGQLGYWQVDRGVFEVVIPRAEVADLAEERHEFPIAALGTPALGAGSAGGMGPAALRAAPADRQIPRPELPRAPEPARVPEPARGPEPARVFESPRAAEPRALESPRAAELPRAADPSRTAEPSRAAESVWSTERPRAAEPARSADFSRAIEAPRAEPPRAPEAQRASGPQRAVDPWSPAPRTETPAGATAWHGSPATEDSGGQWSGYQRSGDNGYNGASGSNGNGSPNAHTSPNGYPVSNGYGEPNGHAEPNGRAEPNGYGDYGESTGSPESNGYAEFGGYGGSNGSAAPSSYGNGSGSAAPTDFAPPSWGAPKPDDTQRDAPAASALPLSAPLLSEPRATDHPGTDYQATDHSAGVDYFGTSHSGTETPAQQAPADEHPRTTGAGQPDSDRPHSATVVRGRRAARKPRVSTQSVFAELLDQAKIPSSSYAVDEEVSGAMCLIKTKSGGFEVFSCADDARHEVRAFEDEEAAYFYLFGVLAAEAVRNGTLSAHSS